MRKPDTQTSDPAHNVLKYERQPLAAIFSPQNVAVIGATEKPGSVGRTILWNLISSPFGGTVFPVNPKRANVLGIKAYPDVAAVPEPVDLAVVVTPAPTVPGVIGECLNAGVQGAIIISAGFKEIGQAGADLERQILEQAQRGKMRLIGPNCLGIMRPPTGLNATFASTMARPGNVGFVSQSGALCTAILDWSLRELVGFSAFISLGSMLDVNWGDIIDYLGNDPKTQSIVIYMESIGDARAFLSAAREVALTKPIIVIKGGRTEAAAKAAASHTGALTGSDEVLDAAFRRCGVLRVDNIAHLFYMAEVLSKQPRPKGPRLAILTNAGGPGVLAMEQTRIFTALMGVRGRKPVDISRLEQIMVLFSRLVVEQRWVREIDINPLLVSPEQLLALDARVVLHGAEVTEDQLPGLPIRPYPAQYVTQWKMKDGTPVTIRPIRPEDEPLLVRFHEALSDRSVYLRYASTMKLGQRVAHERLTRICFIDYDRDMVLVAEHIDPGTGTHDIIGVGRLSKLHGTDEAECAVLVSDRFQRREMGTELMLRILQVGKDEKLRHIVAYILFENHVMQRICEKLGFRFHRTPGDPLVRAEIHLH